MRYVGDGYVVDRAAFTVELDGEPIVLEPQAMDLLLFMLGRRDELLTKAELLDSVWGDQFVTESALATRIKQIRRAVGDDGRSQRVIQTVHGRGYKFIGAVVEDTNPEYGDEATVSAAPAPSDGVTPSHNIAPARTPLIGRDSLIDTVAEAMGEAGLVSLIGIGGAGKTSLAQEVGRRAVDSTADGVWFVDLIPVKDVSGIIETTARAIGVPIADTDPATLGNFLAGREMVIILDNCEHVIDDAATVCAALLDAAPRLTLLATSREPLRVVGERRIVVGPLPVTSNEGGAIDLLHDVAERYGASIPPADEVAAVSLCQRIDGLPLAIELVGARLPIFSAPELLVRLEAMTESESRDRRPDRHASLSAVLADTFSALDPGAVQLLTALARIEGAFDIADIEALATEAGVSGVMGHLASLIDRSLLVSASDGSRRYTLLETVRQYAAANDPDPGSTAAAHTDWCLSVLGASLHQSFYDMSTAIWVSARYADIITAERNLTDAGRHDDAARLIAGTGLAMHLDDGARAAHVVKRLAAHAERGLEPGLAARVHCAGVMASMAAREHRAMYEHGLAAVDEADKTDDPSLQGLARVMRSWAGVVIDPIQAVADLDDAIEMATSIGDDGTALMATGYKVHHLAMALQFDEAARIGNEAYGRTQGNQSYPRRVVATGLICVLVIDDPERVLEIDDETRSESPGLTFWGSAILRSTAHAALDRLEATRELVEQLEARLHRVGIVPLPDLLLVPAALAHVRGDLARASRYLGAVRASTQPTQSLMVSTAYRAMRNHIPPTPREAIGDTTEAVWAEARDWMFDLT